MKNFISLPYCPNFVDGKILETVPWLIAIFTERYGIVVCGHPNKDAKVPDLTRKKIPQVVTFL